ncbi:hypothetical protein BC567DRAFT_97195 [Phyllosticta citribraziliensis]
MPTGPMSPEYQRLLRSSPERASSVRLNPLLFPPCNRAASHTSCMTNEAVQKGRGRRYGGMSTFLAASGTSATGIVASLGNYWTEFKKVAVSYSSERVLAGRQARCCQVGAPIMSRACEVLFRYQAMGTRCVLRMKLSVMTALLPKHVDHMH